MYGIVDFINKVKNSAKSKSKGPIQADDVSDILRYYETSGEEGRPSRQNLEYLVTLQLLEKFIQPETRVLELGAAAGQYTAVLAQKSCHVTAVDLSPSLVEINKALTKNFGLSSFVEYFAEDARSFVSHCESSFDSCLVMGPLYHLTQKSDQIALLQNCKKLVGKKGRVISAHLTKVGYLSYVLAHQPASILSLHKEVPEIWKSGHVENHPRNGQFRGYFTDLKELKDLHRSAGLEITSIHCQDPCIGGMDEIFNRLPQDLKVVWAKFLASVSDDSMVLGSGRSLLCVAKPVN